jgi:hypothetical protein
MADTAGGPRLQRRPRGWLLLPPLLTAVLGGCVFPSYKLLQPPARVQILSDTGEPIGQAQVILMAYANPHPAERTRDRQVTDNQGVAQFEGRREWRTEAPFIIHGVEYYFWRFCVQKPGFETHLTPEIRSGTVDTTIRLGRGPSQDCPAAGSWSYTGLGRKP